MKRKLLFAALCVVSVLGLRAQTDVTNTYITDADFVAITGWTQEHPSQYWSLGNGKIGTYAVANSKTSTTDKTHLATESCLGIQCRWSTNYAAFTQTTSTLPAGVYTLKFDVQNTNSSTTSATYENRFKVTVGETVYADNKTEWMDGSSDWTTHTISFTLESAATATISLGYGTGSNNFGTGATPHLYVSHLSLTYQDLLAGVKALWEAAKADAEAAIANGDYANVTGSEKTDLQAEIAKAEPTTQAGYTEATTALNNATSTFTGAKANYDALATVNGLITSTGTLSYADSAKKPATESATSASDADTKTASQYTALRAYYESHAMAEGVQGAVNMTDRITNPNAEDNNNGWTWTGSKNNPASNEPWTNADGNNTHTYFDGGNWNGSNWTTTMKQTISLPAGKFLLTAKGRAATNTTLTMAVGEASVNLPNVGNAGNVFGRGWGDGSVEFTTDGSDVEIAVTATASPTHEWFSIGDFRLVRLELYTEMATSTEYDAMAAALATAKTKTLGFDETEYAPYENVEAIQAITAAEAVDTDAENAKADIEAITTALGNWTVNAAEKDAIYDGQFANTAANSTSGDINLPGWTKVDGIRLLVKDETTDPGLAYTDGKAAVFSWGGTTLTYGEQTGYTLPLNRYSLYEVTLKLAGWRDGDLPSYVSVNLDGDTKVYDGGLSVGKVNAAEGNPFVTLKAYLKATADGPSKLQLFGNKHFVVADISMKLANAEDIIIAESATAAPAYNYANVTLTRKLSASYWNSFSVPFDAEIPSGWIVKEFDSATDNVISFKDASTLEAGKPYLVKPDADATNPTFNSVIVEATEGETMGTGDYKFAAQIYNKSLATDGTIAYLATDGNVKKLTDGGIKGLRAYFIVPASSTETKALVLDFGDGTTGIATVENGVLNIEENAPVFNLAGQRVSKAQKGIYIQNGKKVIKK